MSGQSIWTNYQCCLHAWEDSHTWFSTTESITLNNKQPVLLLFQLGWFPLCFFFVLCMKEQNHFLLLCIAWNHTQSTWAHKTPPSHLNQNWCCLYIFIVWNNWRNGVNTKCTNQFLFGVKIFCSSCHNSAVFPCQDPCGRDQRSAGRGEEDGERRAAGHHLGASAHGQTDPVHAVQHAGQRRPGQVLHTHNTQKHPEFSLGRLQPKALLWLIILHPESGTGVRVLSQENIRFCEVRTILVWRWPH